MQSIHKEQYEAVMSGARFEPVMHWMKYLAEKKCETGLQLTVTFVRTTQTDEEVREYSDFWNNLGVSVGECLQHSRGGFLSEAGAAGDRKVRRCHLFETRLFVAANGDVLACCQDLNGQSKLGTIGVDPLSVILARKQAKIKTGVMYPMCASCTDVGAGIYE